MYLEYCILLLGLCKILKPVSKQIGSSESAVTYTQSHTFCHLSQDMSLETKGGMCDLFFKAFLQTELAVFGKVINSWFNFLCGTLAYNYDHPQAQAIHHYIILTKPDT